MKINFWGFEVVSVGAVQNQERPVVEVEENSTTGITYLRYGDKTAPGVVHKIVETVGVTPKSTTIYYGYGLWADRAALTYVEKHLTLEV